MAVATLDLVSGKMVAVLGPLRLRASCSPPIRSHSAKAIKPLKAAGRSIPEESLLPRFYFDLTNGRSNIRDDEGVVANDLIEATQEARAVLEEMRRSEELSHEEGGWLLIIRDAEGTTLETLPVV